MFDQRWITRRLFILVGMLFLAMYFYYAGTLIADRKCLTIVQPSAIFQHPDTPSIPSSGYAQIFPKIAENRQNERSVANPVHNRSVAKVQEFLNFKERHSGDGSADPDFIYTGSAVPGEDYSVVPYDFYRALAPGEILIFQDLLATLDRVTRQYNITMFMNFGTLLGSFRHHAIVPWDDDCDVAMPYARKYTVLYLLKNLYSTPYSLPELARSTNATSGEYEIQVTADTQFRFTSGHSQYNRPGWPFRWPYVDIDFYMENETSIWTINSNVYKIHSRNVVFPLHLRPLGSIWLLAPRDSHQFMMETFKDVSLCSTGMNHKVGREKLVRRTPCETLKAAYPFVHRSLTRDGRVLETLKLDEKELYSIVVEELRVTASVDPFTFKRET